MKKIATILLTLLAVAFNVSIAQAQQDSKHPYGLVTQEGKVISSEGRMLGWISREGVISDSAGAKIAYIDKEGNLVDHKTGKKLGKAQKNGHFKPYDPKTPDQGWTVSHPMNGTCEVKNANGEVIVLVHENYKQHGACAYHCLSLKQQEKMKMK